MRKTRSSILNAVYETAKGFHEAKIMDKSTMREFARLCLSQGDHCPSGEIVSAAVRKPSSKPVS